MQYLTDDTRITGMQEVTGPGRPHRRPAGVSPRASELVFNDRRTISDIIHGRDQRLLVIVGPCSIHDPKAGLEYAQGLCEQAQKHRDQLHIIMRVYFEKPRTTIGWKGLINDPQMNNSYDINNGLRVARTLLRDIVELGVGCGTEYLDPISPQYVGDFVSWGAIGARTTESQIHRQFGVRPLLPDRLQEQHRRLDSGGG